MKSIVHFSSKTNEWSTPDEFFNKVASEFGPFDMDVCATEENAKCDVFFDKNSDGLSKDWRGVCWMNPPYGREIGKWVKKAWESSFFDGATVVCLVPSRTDTAWWHEHVVRGEVRFIRGRLKFGGCKSSAPFPSALVVFRP